MKERKETTQRVWSDTILMLDSIVKKYTSLTDNLNKSVNDISFDVKLWCILRRYKKMCDELQKNTKIMDLFKDDFSLSLNYN